MEYSTYALYSDASQNLKMEEELPIPIGELLLFIMFLSSLTLLIGVALIAIIMKRNREFRWLKFLFLSIAISILTIISGYFIWAIWPISTIDIMLGPIHLPSMISLIIVIPIVLKIFGYRILKKKTVPNIE